MNIVLSQIHEDVPIGPQNKRLFECCGSTCRLLAARRFTERFQKALVYGNVK